MKKVILSIIFLFFVFQVCIFGQIPQGYYNSIDGKQERELKTALHKILKNHTQLSYNDLWWYFRTTDVRPGTSEVWDMYSNTVRYYVPATNSGYSVSGMNKEHSLPRSWWNNDNLPAYSDLHHLYPSDADANSHKSNYILGKVNSPSWTNNVTRIGKNAYAYSGAPTVTAFEPANEYKGDFARAYMYMVTCYEDFAPLWRSDALQMFDNVTYPVFKPWAKQMLLEWHRNDPVSPKERNRNEEVFHYQNNRNPFVDFPQLAEYIWGDSVNYTFNLSGEVVAKSPVLVTPVNLTDLFFGEIQKNSEVSRSITLKGYYMTENVSVKIWSKNSDFFSLSSISAPASAVNSEAGYEIEIFYNPTEYGEHTTSLVIQDGGMDGTVCVYLKGICSANPSAVIPPEAQSPDVYVQNNVITFRTYAPNDSVYIYNSLGKIMHSETGTGKWQEFRCPQSGMYIIQLNGKTRKILVKE